jgi:mandelate racemase
MNASCDWLEWRDWGNPITAQPFEIVDGHAVFPNRPGNGIECNQAMVAKFQY